MNPTIRNLVSGVLCLTGAGAVLFLLLGLVSRDAAALAGAVVIWVAGMIWGISCMLGERGFQERTPLDSEQERAEANARFILARYQPVLYVQFLLSSLWIGLVAEHWLLVAVCYVGALLLALRSAAGPRFRSREPHPRSLALIVGAVLLGTILRAGIDLYLH